MSYEIENCDLEAQNLQPITDRPSGDMNLRLLFAAKECTLKYLDLLHNGSRTFQSWYDFFSISSSIILKVLTKSPGSL